MADPRERLVVAGNALLDAIFAEETFNESHREILAKLKHDSSPHGAGLALESIPERERGRFILQMMQTSTDRQRAMQNYIVLRETIEAFAGGRPEMSEP